MEQANVEAEKAELLSGLIEYMGKFEKGLQETVELYQGGNIEAAKNKTIEIIDGLGWIVEGVEVLKSKLEIDVTLVIETLQQLQESLANDDDVMTADIFENELLPTVGTWKQRMMDVEHHADTAV